MNRLCRFLERAGGETLRKIHFPAAAVVLAVVMYGIAPPSHAETPADLEAFRRDLAQVLQELDQQRATLRQNPLIGEVLAQSKLDPAPTLEEAQKQLQEMNPKQLARVYEGFSTAFPTWREAPEVLGRLARKIGDKSAVTRLDLPGPRAISPDNCQDAFNAAPSWTDWGVTEAFAIGAQGAYEIIPPPINAIAMAAWIPLEEGANAAEILNNIFDRCSGDQSIGDIQTAINTTNTSIGSSTTTILGGLASATTTITSNDNTNTATITNNANSNTATITNNTNSNTATITSNDNANKTTIVANDNTNTTNILDTLNEARGAIITSGDASTAAIIANDNTNKAAIIANDNTNTANVLAALNAAQTAIINNDNANKNELQDLMLRTQIEQDLAEADSSVPVAVFLTPTANGGHLDLVQNIVTETLANILAAGGSIGQAQSFLADADAKKTAGDFKGAYKAYRKAYKTAVN